MPVCGKGLNAVQIGFGGPSAQVVRSDGRTVALSCGACAPTEQIIARLQVFSPQPCGRPGENTGA